MTNTLANSLFQSQISESRVETVRKAFQHLASGDEISWDSLQSRFRAAEHPRVTLREKKPAAIYKEFQQGCSKYVKNGCVSAEAFLQYYLDVNSVLPAEKDAYFTQAVTRTWGLAQATPLPLHY